MDRKKSIRMFILLTVILSLFIQNNYIFSKKVNASDTDSEAPKIEILSPMEGSTVNKRFCLWFRVTDNDGINSIKCFINFKDKPWNNLDEILTYGKKEYEYAKWYHYSCTWFGYEWSPCRGYKIRVIATDILGNEASKEVHFDTSDDSSEPGLVPYFLRDGHIEGTHVFFDVESGITKGGFSAYIKDSGYSVKPGSSTTITFCAQSGSGSLTMRLGNYGSKTIAFKTPLHSTYIPIYDIDGLDSVNVYMSGTLEGDLSVSGPGSLSATHLSWNSWGTKSIILHANDNAWGTITVELTLYYTGTIKAEGKTATGDVMLIPLQDFQKDKGSRRVVLNIPVENNEEVGSGIPGFEMMALIVALGAAMWVKRRK